MGLVANQVCSPVGSGEHANSCKLFKIVGFSVSLRVNPITDLSPGRIRDSSGIPGISQIVSRVGLSVH